MHLSFALTRWHYILAHPEMQICCLIASDRKNFFQIVAHFGIALFLWNWFLVDSYRALEYLSKVRSTDRLVLCFRTAPNTDFSSEQTPSLIYYSVKSSGKIPWQVNFLPQLIEHSLQKIQPYAYQEAIAGSLLFSCNTSLRSFTDKSFFCVHVHLLGHLVKGHLYQPLTFWSGSFP